MPVYNKWFCVLMSTQGSTYSSVYVCVCVCVCVCVSTQGSAQGSTISTGGAPGTGAGLGPTMSVGQQAPQQEWMVGVEDVEGAVKECVRCSFESRQSAYVDAVRGHTQTHTHTHTHNSGHHTCCCCATLGVRMTMHAHW